MQLYVSGKSDTTSSLMGLKNSTTDILHLNWETILFQSISPVVVNLLLKKQIIFSIPWNASTFFAAARRQEQKKSHYIHSSLLPLASNSF